jgi:outer membrane protein insertion porin family
VNFKIYFLLLLFFLNSKIFCSGFYIQKISFDSDINFERSEFFYLTDLKENSFISDEDINNAKDNLIKKGRFSFVEFKLLKDSDCINLHFELRANWILNKVVLQGILFGKYSYLYFYKQSPGDTFDLLTHEKNIEDIKCFLFDKGYFNSSVLDELIYNKKDKSITVKIFIKKRSCFTVSNVYLNIISKKELIETEKNKFIDQINSKFISKIKNRSYSNKKLNKFKNKIINFFKRRDFLNIKLNIKKQILKKEGKLNLLFDINLGEEFNLKFIGNKFFTTKEIKKDLLGRDFPVWFFTPDLIAQQVFQDYYKKGYWNASIFYKTEEENKYIFNIKENEPIIIDEIIVHNQNDFLDEEITYFFDDLRYQIFNEDILDQFINKLKNYFLRNGFWKFEILSKEFIKNNTNNRCKIFMKIKKGKQRCWENVKIKDFNYVELNNYFSKYSKSLFCVPADFYDLQKQKQYILKYFQKKGYWYAEVFPSLKENILDKDRVSIFLDWQIVTGPKVKFGKIFLKGDTSLSFSKILKELNFEYGETWDKRKINLSLKNLKKLDVFKKAWIEPDEQALILRKEFIPIKTTLIDQDPVQISLRLGYFLTNKNFLFKRTSTFKAGGSFILNNPTNQLDRLSFNMDFTRFERKIDLDYKILSPLGLTFKNSRLIGKFKAYSNKYINPVQVNQSQNAYEAIENGFFVGLNNEYKKDYFWRFNLGNEWIETSKVRGNLNFRQDYVNKTLPYFFINPSFIIEKVDDSLDVKKGSISFFSLKFMIPEYQGKPTSKLMWEQSIFKPIYKDTLIAARFRLGYILNSEFNEVQPSQRFYLGGPYSVRGYDKDALSPYGKQIVDDKTEYTIQGGSGMVNANLELRFPLFKSLRGVIFQDIGVLSQTGFAGFKGKWFPSSGFGFRYKTPIGPIRFDLGFKWKHLLPGDTSYAWYLTLGEVF